MVRAEIRKCRSAAECDLRGEYADLPEKEFIFQRGCFSGIDTFWFSLGNEPFQNQTGRTGLGYDFEKDTDPAELLLFLCSVVCKEQHIWFVLCHWVWFSGLCSWNQWPVVQQRFAGFVCAESLWLAVSALCQSSLSVGRTAVCHAAVLFWPGRRKKHITFHTVMKVMCLDHVAVRTWSWF